MSEAPAAVPRKIQPHPGNVGSGEMRVWGILKQNLSAPLGDGMGKQSGMASAEEPSHYQILGTRWGVPLHSQWFGASGSGLGSIPSFPQHLQPGAALLLEQTCLLVTPGRAVGGRFGWNASGIVTIFTFFWQILNKHLGKALNSSWKIPAASRRGAARSCRSRATCPQQTPRLPPGIVLPPVSQLSAGTDRAGRV